MIIQKNRKADQKESLKCSEAPSEPGILWIGTDNGIFEFDTKTGISNNYTNDENDPSSLASNLVRDILEDHSGILWFAAGNKGLTKLNRFRPNFKYILTDIPQTRVSENNVYTLYKDDENLYAGTYEDIIKIDLIKGSKIPLARKFNLTPYIRHNRINSIFIDHLDRYWIGTSDNGILVVQSDTLLAHISEGSKNRLQSNKISFIRAFNNSDLWVGTRGGGLDQIDLTTLSIKAHYIDSSASNKVNVLSYFQDGNDYLWIGTTRGIRKFDLREKMFIPFNFEETFESEIGDDMVLNIISNGIEDSILWLGTLNRGLCRLDLASGEFKRITLQNSNLPSNTINSILDFGNSTLWLTTNNRLVRYDTKNDESRVYSSDDGVKINKFHAKSAYKDENRRLYFGGTEGILHFDPSKVKKNLNLPKLIVNDFLINGKSIIRKGNKSFVQHIIDEKEISLNHDQNSISIEFVALHFASPQNNKYEYQLINYDEKPILTTTQRRITYRNLSPGSYMFKLKASNADGIKAANELAYEIIIAPPFYKTWWAYTLYVLVLIGLVQLYRKYEVNKQLEASRIKESELRAEQAELKAETAAAQAKVIQIESERQTKELEDARKLQLSMLPETIPLSDKFEIAVYMRTASEVGGDYYDFSISEDETLNIGFGDATGHGMQAGVVVSLIKGLFVSDSADNDLATFMLKSNNTIKKSRLGRMMMAFTLLKLKDNRLLVSSAGMPPILMYSKKSQHVEEINLMGMPLGAMLDFPYKDFNLQLDQGDTLLLMSDGLPELANEEGEQMAYFRISKIFKDVGSRNPDRIIEAIVEAADEWRGEHPIEDDISLLVLKIK